MKNDIKFLKELQKQMQYEDEHDNDSQASPRFWVLRDSRTVPIHEDYADRTQYYHSDGDFTEFDTIEELQGFMERYYTDGLVSEEEFEYYIKNKNADFEDLWDWVIKNHNEDGFFGEVPVKDEWFIVPNTMFLTKEEAKKHIELNHYHYTRKVHTYAMTAWRAPKVERLLKILNEFDFDSINA